MQVFVREVTCDCCGKRVNDLFGGYDVKRLGSRVYDICSDCMAEIDAKIDRHKKDIVQAFFTNKDGRDTFECYSEEGDNSEE